jgi:hypothetical protein
MFAVLLLALAACTTNTSGGTGSETARKTFEATVDNVQLSVSMPASMRPDPDGPGMWTERPGGSGLYVFAVVIDAELVTSLDKAKYQSTLSMSDSRFVRAEERAGRYLLTNFTATGEVEATTFVSTPRGWLKCKAIAKQPGRTARALVESICDSVAVK